MSPAVNKCPIFPPAASQFCWLHIGQTEVESVFRHGSKEGSLSLGKWSLTFSSPAPPFRSCVRWHREQRGYSTCSAAWQTPPWPPPSPSYPRRPTLFCKNSENGGEGGSNGWLGKRHSAIKSMVLLLFRWRRQLKENFKYVALETTIFKHIL